MNKREFLVTPEKLPREIILAAPITISDTVLPSLQHFLQKGAFNLFPYSFDRFNHDEYRCK
jgi:hypothetical protein